MSFTSIIYDNITSTCRCYLEISRIHEAFTYTKAIVDFYWMKVMQTKISALQENNTWEVVELPDSKEAIRCKWVYKVKYNFNGTLDRYKVRLVAKGYTKKLENYFKETFSQVVKIITVTILLIVAATCS